MTLKITKETKIDGTIIYFVWKDVNIIATCNSEVDARHTYEEAKATGLPKTEVIARVDL